MYCEGTIYILGILSFIRNLQYKKLKSQIRSLQYLSYFSETSMRLKESADISPEKTSQKYFKESFRKCAFAKSPIPKVNMIKDFNMNPNISNHVCCIQIPNLTYTSHINFAVCIIFLLYFNLINFFSPKQMRVDAQMNLENS